ncbi:MAG: hypothetical protein LBH69_00345, partial [Methanomassiliicoccaceae archaeon]|nr:hypothetical protein [Methanomassiliicoccaceae archaeon]
SAQWYKDDKLISGANSMTLSVKSDADNGVYVLKVRYAAAAGTTGEITSDPITVKITGSEGGGFPILIVVALIAVIAVAGAAVYLFVLKK